MEIFDRFIRKKERGYSNLIRILDLCKELKECIIHTSNVQNNINNRFDIEFSELKEELNKKYAVGKIELVPTKQHRRKIITDDFEIRIDPGLDFVNKEFICKENDVDIQISVFKK